LRANFRCWPRKAPTAAELSELAYTLAFRFGRYLERQGLLERDAENSYLVGAEIDTGPLAQLQGASITYRVAVGPRQGRKAARELRESPTCCRRNRRQP